MISGKYRLGPLLGEGGMGVVYAATHLVTGKDVALKLLRPGRRVKNEADAARARERALREARASVAVRDPRVLGIDDVLDHDDALVLVMDRLHGETLRARLDREKKLAYEVARPILVDLAEAILAAHEAHVVHRDLKPDNVFLLASARAATSGACEVRVLDFGIAKWMTDEDPDAPSAPALTTTGAMLGTPMYMSPEQAFGERDVDARADAWAFGVLAFEALAGERPVAGDNLGQVLKAIATGTRPPLAERDTDAPAHVCQAVDRLLVSDRDARGSLAEALGALRSDGPLREEGPEGPLARAVSVAPPGLGTSQAQSASLEVRPPKWLVALGLGLVALTVAGGLLVFAARPVVPPPDAPRGAATTEPHPVAPPVAPSTSVPSPGSTPIATVAVVPSGRPPPSSSPKLASTAKASPAAGPSAGPVDTRGAGGTVVAPPF